MISESRAGSVLLVVFGAGMFGLGMLIQYQRQIDNECTARLCPSGEHADKHGSKCVCITPVPAVDGGVK